MKRRLNLFAQRTSSKKVLSYYVIARRASLIFFGILVLIVSILGGSFFYFNNQLKKIESDTVTYKRYILGNETFSRQIQEFVFKYKILRSYLKDDARSYEYYTVLLDLLNRTAASEILTSFSVDKTQNTEFTLQFSSYDDAILFVEELESPMIFEVFSTIKLDGLDLSPQATDDYQLSLSGTFIPLETNES